MAKSPLKYDYDFYTPSSIRAALKSGEVTQADIDAEFKHLRAIAKSRAASFQRAGRGEMEIAQRLSKLAQSGYNTHNLADLAYTLSLKTSTVRGVQTQNQRRLKTLHSHGYGFVNAGNIEEFGRFMQAIKNSKIGQVISSDVIAEMFAAAKKAHIDTEKVQAAFDNWEEADKATKNFITKQLQVMPAEVLRKAWGIK